MDGLQRHAAPRLPASREAGVPPLHVGQWTHRHACQTQKYKQRSEAGTRTLGHHTPQPPATPAPDTLGNTAPPTGYLRTRHTWTEKNSTTTPHQSNNSPPHWATRQTASSQDASRTPSISPSTMQPCARIASRHTCRNPGSNPPSSSCHSSPDPTDGTHADPSTSPHGTANASAATQLEEETCDHFKTCPPYRGLDTLTDWNPAHTIAQHTRCATRSPTTQQLTTILRQAEVLYAVRGGLVPTAVYTLLRTHRDDPQATAAHMQRTAVPKSATQLTYRTHRCLLHAATLTPTDQARLVKLLFYQP